MIKIQVTEQVFYRNGVPTVLERPFLDGLGGKFDHALRLVGKEKISIHGKVESYVFAVLPVEGTCRRCTACCGGSHHFAMESWDPKIANLDDHPQMDLILADWRTWLVTHPDESPVCPVVWICNHCDHWQRMKSCPECGEFLDPETDLCLDEDCEDGPGAADAFEGGDPFDVEF